MEFKFLYVEDAHPRAYRWGTAPEAEKGVEVGKKLPRKFPSLAESFGAYRTRDVTFFNNLNIDLVWTFYWEIYHHKFRFHVRDSILFLCYTEIPFCWNNYASQNCFFDLLLFVISFFVVFLLEFFLLVLKTFLQKLVWQKGSNFLSLIYWNL